MEKLFNKFIIKLKDFKQRLWDRKMYSVVIAVIAVLLSWGFFQGREISDLKNKLNNQYNRSFYDMSGYVSNVEVLLAKAMITSTPSKTASTLQEAWRQANMAQANLMQLPVSQEFMFGTSKFLTQIGDFAYSLNFQNMKGEMVTEKQYKSIESLYNYCRKLNEDLMVLQEKVYNQKISWGSLEKQGNKIFASANMIYAADEFADIDKIFLDYPVLIYDGPFSDHMTQIEPVGLTGDEISKEEASKKAAEFFGEDRIDEIKLAFDNNSGNIPTYSFEVVFKNENNEKSINNPTARIDITKKGGHYYFALYPKQINEIKITPEQAVKLGEEFLENHGYQNMKATYYMQQGAQLTVNYAYNQENTVVYSDLIKVKIALDTGEITGIEAKGYLYSHMIRNIPKEQVSEDEARSQINDKIKILNTKMSYIPTNYSSEIYCYEFTGKLNDRDFLIYVNAVTGEEEKILLIIDSENGVLTM